MIGIVNVDLIAVCPIDDEDEAEMIAEGIGHLIIAQAYYASSGAFYEPEE